MKKFDYLMPHSIDEAISLHEAHGERAKYVAGGTDVMVKIKERKIAPDYLVSLKHVPDLSRIEEDKASGDLRIGSLVTHRMLETSPVIKERYPVLHDAVRVIGSVQIRNVATIGGNLCNAVPSADGAIPLVSLDSRLRIRGPKGDRTIDILDFFLGPGQTILERGEVLVEIVIPPSLPHTGGAYIKHGRREAMELPLLGVAVVLSLEENRKKCKRARIALGVAAPTPIRAFQAERELEGKDIDEEALDRAGQVAAEEARVRDSIRGVAWYRRDMVKVLVKRMGMKCLELAAAK